VACSPCELEKKNIMIYILTKRIKNRESTNFLETKQTKNSSIHVIFPFRAFFYTKIFVKILVFINTDSENFLIYLWNRSTDTVGRITCIYHILSMAKEFSIINFDHSLALSKMEDEKVIALEPTPNQTLHCHWLALAIKDCIIREHRSVRVFFSSFEGN